MKFILFLMLNMALSAAISSVEGRRIYLEGKDIDGQNIDVVINDLKSDAALGCVNCHRESGLGTSESGTTYPPVSWRFLSQKYPKDGQTRFAPLQNNRPAYTPELVHRLLTTGVNSKGEQADKLMPLYDLSEQKTINLVSYLKTLYTEDDPGVDQDTIKIATILDSRLPDSEKQQHVEFLQGLVSMKNSGTRGELNRKKNSPVQKKPQYESYRKWDFRVWELPVDTALWGQVLEEYYRQQPVFVVLAPALMDNYSILRRFCSRKKMPCLFPHSSEDIKGDYYNFVFRDTEKQRRDYIASRLRKGKDHFLYLDDSGQINDLKADRVSFNKVNKQMLDSLNSMFSEICVLDKTLIVAVDSDSAQKLYQMDCPEEQRLKIELLGEPSMSYQDISSLLNKNSNPAICWVTAYSKMLKRNTRRMRVIPLARKFGLTQTNDENLAKDLFAFGVLTDSLHQLAGNYSRQYLLEIMEHMLNSFPNYTYFDTVSGAPYQRAIAGPLKGYCSVSRPV